MFNFLKPIFRRLLLSTSIRNFFVFLRAIYFCKIKKKITDFDAISQDTWKNTLHSNKRKIFDKNIDLPSHPDPHKLFDIGTKLATNSYKYLLDVIKEKHKKSDYKNLRILTIGPRSEGEIYGFFASGFELRNIVGVDLFSYSPYVKLGDMHNLNFQNKKFDIVFMGKCLAYSNNKEKAILEAKKVLNDEGSLVIVHSLSKKLVNSEEIIKKRGYLISSPKKQIVSKENLDSLTQSLGFKKFYLKVFEKKLTNLVVYGGSK